MTNHNEDGFLSLVQTQSFPSYTSKPVVYGTERYRQLLTAKTILSLYGYNKHESYFDIVVNGGICFNIISDERGFYLKQTNNEDQHEIY